MFYYRRITRMIAIIILPYFIWAVFSPASYAMNDMDFKNHVSPTTDNMLNMFLEKTFETTLPQYLIATIDLNNDGLNEYVLKRQYCDNDEIETCTYLFLAEYNKNPILIGSIRAKNVLVSTTSTHNIKDILAFKNNLNDYDFDIYVWSQKEKMYILTPNKVKVSAE